MTVSRAMEGRGGWMDSACGSIGAPERVPRILVVGGSPLSCPPGLIALLAEKSDAVVAVDHGLDAVLKAGLGCDLFCGDADSVGELGARAVLRCEEGAEGPVLAVERYDPRKDFTDLSLALRAIWERWGAADLTCTCLSGGRPDHALAALGCLMRWKGGVQLWEEGFIARILRAGDAWHMRGRGGSTFSFVCLSPTGVVSEVGMEWELDHERVELLGDLGISNVLGSDACIDCHEGVIAAYLID